MSTIKLFETDSYATSFKSEIINISENYVILNETLFYANSGGQPGDIGIFFIIGKEYNVIDTIKGENGSIKHIINEDITELKEGMEVEGKVDWDRRYALMKNHTALHLLNALILVETGAMVTGAQVGVDKSRIDFNTEGMDKEKMEKIIDECNKIILQEYDIKIECLSVEEFQKDPSLVRTMSVAPTGQSSIRVINIMGLDRQACGGTHLKNLNEIKSIKLNKLQNKGKNNKRVYIEVV